MIIVDGLFFGYKKGEPVIDSLSHEFPAGTVTAVTGRSGRGKSTLLGLIGLLLSPWAGRILWGDRWVGELSDSARSTMRARHIGFVFQDAALDPARTVLDNVCEAALYAQADVASARAKANELLERFGVDIRADHRPGEISGGQAQRVALCRALLLTPDLVLADEPTGNLDAASAEIVLGALEEAAENGATVLIASHSAHVVARADHVLAL